MTLAACLGPEPEATGTVAVNLVAQAPSGNVYRLRDATIVVQGPISTQHWSTEDDPSRTSLSADVVIGDYSSALASGWRIERVQGMSTTTVPAELLTMNPVGFTVVQDQRTSVPLRFRVLGEDLDMGQGYDIILDIEECTLAETACGDGLDNDCDGAIDCADSDCDAAPACSTCGDGVVEGAEECDDGNLANLDGCSSTCTLELSEVEPNEDGSPSLGGHHFFGNDYARANADANGAFTGDTTLVARLVPAGDEDVFAFENPSQTEVAIVRFDLWSSALGIGVPCGPATIGTVLSIRDTADTILAFNDDRDGLVDRCSGLWHPIAPGQRVYAHVTDFGDNAEIPNYVLVATYAMTCGDGALDPGEQCDDGNNTSGDGCSQTCQFEDLLELEPNDTLAAATTSPLQIASSRTLTGALSTPADRDTFRITVVTPTVVRFDPATSHSRDCQSAIRVHLLDAVGQTIADSANLGLPCGGIAMYLETGVYFVQLDGAGSVVPSYLLMIQYQSARDAELEPVGTSGFNDAISTASLNLLVGSDVYVFGDHSLENDIDVYAITVPPGARIRAKIIEGNRAAETCESGGVDSHLTLLDQNGATLASDDDGGRGFCSRIDGLASPPLNAGARNPTSIEQTYYLRVARSPLATGGQRVFQYRLQVTVQ